MKRFKKVIYRISIIACICVFSLVVVITTTKPTETKAVVPAIAAGAAFIVAFLSAAGVSLTAQNIANNSSMTDTINNLANQYSQETGAPTVEEQMAAKDALNFYYNDQAGEAFVSANERMVTWAEGFKNWFVQNFALTDSGETIIFNDNFLVGPNGEKYLYYPDRYIFVNGKVPSSIIPVVGNQVENMTISLPNGEAYFRITVGEPYEYYGRRIPITLQGLNADGTVTGTFNHPYGLNGHNDFSYIRIFFSQNNGSLWLSLAPSDAGDYTVWNYGLATGISVESLDLDHIGLSGSLTDGYQDFQDALDDAKTDAGENGQIAIGVGDIPIDKPYTQEGVAEGILDNAIANTGEGVLVGGYADEREVEEDTEAEKVPSYAEIGQNIVVIDGLEDFFPFCIPFDIYEVFKVFDVPPKTPHMELEVPFTGVRDYPVPLVIDLGDFDTAARIFRILLVITFLLFLAFKTRDLIRG